MHPPNAGHAVGRAHISHRREAPSAGPSAAPDISVDDTSGEHTNSGRLNSPPASGTSAKLQVTGTVPTQPPGGAPAVDAVVVPAGATAVILNATVVRPSTKGFLSIGPGDAAGTPATTGLLVVRTSRTRSPCDSRRQARSMCL